LANTYHQIPINTAIHVIFCTAIALLLAFIIRENAKDYDADIQVLAQKTAQNGQLVIDVSNKALLRECVKAMKIYPSDYVDKYLALTQVILLKSDSIQYLMDGLKENADVGLISDVEEKWNYQQSLIGKMADFDKNIEDKLTSFLSIDRLCQSWENDSKEQFKTVLEQAKTNILLMERGALFYFATKISYDCGFDKVCFPALNWHSTSYIIGDTVHADIKLSRFDRGYYNPKFIVNGIPAPKQKFRQRFNKAGIYPLHIKMESNYWEHDTLLVAEKTYYLTIRK
jgi:hypothetical protein